MDLHLQDKIALVTGASRGLGFATAKLLAQEGANLAINSHSKEKLLSAAETLTRENKGKVAVFPGDLTNQAVPKMLVEQTVETFGGLDILITNAGGPPPAKFDSIEDETWQNAIELSFLSHVRLIRAALPYLKNSSAASVLTITSYSVKQPIPNLILSNSIRAATVGLTKSLALELGSQGIRFNSILPAWIASERILELTRYRANANQTTVEEEMHKQAAECALGRIGTPEELANAMEKMCFNEDFREIVFNNSRKKITKFDEQIMVREYKSLLLK